MNTSDREAAAKVADTYALAASKQSTAAKAAGKMDAMYRANIAWNAAYDIARDIRALPLESEPKPAVEAADALVKALEIADKWILRNSEDWGGDWACAECHPNSEIIVPSFSCAVHAAAHRAVKG